MREAAPDGEGKRASWRNKKAQDFTHFLIHKSTLLSRGVVIPGLESIPESDFHHFSKFDDSDLNSNSSGNLLLHCTPIDSGYWINFKI